MTVQANACHHCRRPVRPTRHLRNGALVDFYRTVTGAGRTESYEDPRSGTTARVLRVERLFELRTCADCWQKPAIQAELARLRRSGCIEPE